MSNVENGMNAQPAIMSMTLVITRAATGKKETVELMCMPIATQQEQKDVDNSQHSVS